MDLSPTEIAAAIIIGISTLLSIVAAAIPDWLVFTNMLGSTTKIGLFRICVDDYCVNHESGRYSYFNSKFFKSLKPLLNLTFILAHELDLVFIEQLLCKP